MGEAMQPAITAPFQQRIVTGWIVMAMTLVMASVSQLMQAAIQTDFSEFAYHPGPGGWWTTCSLFMTYGVVALAVSHVDARWFRWLACLLGFLALAFTAAHHLTHLREGFVGQTYGPFGVIHLHHLASLVVVVQSLRWARAGRPVPGRAEAVLRAATS